MENASREGFEQNDFEQGSIEKIASANTFDELFDVLQQIEMIKGSEKSYPAEVLINKINQVRESAKVSPHAYQLHIGSITSTYGLRSKVEEMVLKDHPGIQNFIKNEEKEEQRADLREKYYQQKLEEEYSFDPVGEYSVDIENAALKNKIEELFDRKAELLGDLKYEEISKDEDLLVLKVHEIIAGILMENGIVSFEEARQNLAVEQAFIGEQDSSIAQYALRKGWYEMKDIIEAIQS